MWRATEGLRAATMVQSSTRVKVCWLPQRECGRQARCQSSNPEGNDNGREPGG